MLDSHRNPFPNASMPALASAAERVYENSGNRPLLDLLSTQPGRILDCGCGAGANARLLSCLGWKVTGITISPAEQCAAAPYCEEVYLADLELGLPPGLGSDYNAVLLSHVLEHLAHPEVLLRALRSVLAPSGVLGVALPNVLFYPNRLRFLLGKFEYTSSGIMDDTHLRFYTFNTGAELLRSSAYRIVRAEADGAFPLWKLRGWLPPSFVGRFNRGASAIWPGLFGLQSLYIAVADS